MTCGFLYMLVDDKKLGDIKPSEFPLYHLYQNYLKLQEGFDLEHQLTPVHTCKDLKVAIRMLEPEIRLRIINEFYKDKRMLIAMGDEEEKWGTNEDRKVRREVYDSEEDTFTPSADTSDNEKSAITSIMGDTELRRFVVKTLVYLVVFIIVLVIGAAIAIGYMQGDFNKDNAFVSSVVTGAVDILRIMFGG